MSTALVQLTGELGADWRTRAACAGFQSLFFPTPDNDREQLRAKTICRACPVSDECLTYALETNQTSGVWGGTGEDERRSLRRKWLATRRRVG